MGNILPRYSLSKVGLCQLQLYYGQLWLAITLHGDQTLPEISGLRCTNCKLIIVNFTSWMTVQRFKFFDKKAL